MASAISQGISLNFGLLLGQMVLPCNLESYTDDGEFGKKMGSRSQQTLNGSGFRAYGLVGLSFLRPLERDYTGKRL